MCVISSICVILVILVLYYYVFTFLVQRCDVRYDFLIKRCSVRLYHPVVCNRAHVLFMLFVFVCVFSGVQHILCCVVFFFILCTLCCQFLWIVHFWLPLRYSLTCIHNILAVAYILVYKPQKDQKKRMHSCYNIFVLHFVSFIISLGKCAWLLCFCFCFCFS